MGQRRDRLNGRLAKQGKTRVQNTPRKAKERIRVAARKDALQQKLDAAGY